MMDEKTITRAERLTLMAYLVAPLLAMTASVYFEGGASPDMSSIRFITGLTVLVCLLLCTARAEGMADWVVIPFKVSSFVFICWAVLVFAFPDGVWTFTLYLSFAAWVTIMVCYTHEMA